MFEVVIDKKTYEHPSKIEEVSLQQWIDLNSEKEDELKAYSKFSGIPMKQLEACNNKEVRSHLIRLAKLFGQAADIQDQDPPEEFTIGNTTYCVNQDMDNAPMSQYLDCTHYMKFFNNNQTEFYPYMMAIYCLRKGEKYDFTPDQLTKRAKKMRKAQAVDAININAFFLHGSQSYANNSQAFFQAKPHTNR